MKKQRFLLLILTGLCLWPGVSSAVTFSEPENFKAIDKPNDNGQAVLLTWKKQATDSSHVQVIPLMSESREGPYHPQEAILSNTLYQTDDPSSFGFSSENAEIHSVEISGFRTPDPEKAGAVKSNPLVQHKEYFFKLKFVDTKDNQEYISKTMVAASPEGDLFAWQMLNNFIFMIILSLAIMLYIWRAKRDPNLFIRKITGLEAVDEALGRATEMGKPVFFCHGLSTMDQVSTIAAMNILGRISEKVAEYDSALKVMNNDPFVMQVSVETVKEAYTKAGRPDTFNPESVIFAGADQFSYAAAIDGMMVRERPAANFFFGYFFAEALLLAETGSTTGAIQIAGTDAYTQVPFFITSCDYTLIGEELYAASAYLSREPKLLGSLKGQDFGKGLLIVVIVIATFFASVGWIGFARFFWPLS